MKIQIFLQARMGSTRVPGKVLLKICGKTIVELIVERLRTVKNIDKIILLTSTSRENAQLVDVAKRLNIGYFQGSEENILDRFYQASLKFKPDAIIRVTGDCPLIDSDLINKGLTVFNKDNYDIVSNARIRSFPDGMDFEIFKRSTIAESWQEQFNKFKNRIEFDKTFCSPTKYILESKKFKNKDVVNRNNLSDIRLTMDYKEDYEVIKAIYEALYKKNKIFKLDKILNFINNNPRLLDLNRKYIHLDYGIEVNKQ